MVTTVAREADLKTVEIEMLDAIRESYSQSRRSPTIRELQDLLRIASSSVVSYRLRTLNRKGYIQLHSKEARGIVLVMRDGEPCPCCGRTV